MKDLLNRVGDTIKRYMDTTSIDVEIDNEHLLLYAKEFDNHAMAMVNMIVYTELLKYKVIISLEPERKEQVCILIFKP